MFARSAPYFYVSSTDSITVYDVSDPVHPKITGTLPNLVFENEAMNYGEKKVDGVINRFVLVGVDLVEASPTAPDHIGTVQRGHGRRRHRPEPTPTSAPGSPPRPTPTR